MSFDSWLTNPIWLEMVRVCMGSIDVDPSSNFIAQNYVHANTFYILPDEEKNNPVIYIGNYAIDGLAQAWFTPDNKNVFCNPPYSAGNIDKFVDKAITEWITAEKDSQMIILVNSADDTKWYQQLLKYSQATLFVKGRIKFWKIENGKAWEKWEGVKSKEKGLGKIGNSPRYINTLFYFGDNITRFKEVFEDKGTIMVKG